MNVVTVKGAPGTYITTFGTVSVPENGTISLYENEAKELESVGFKVQKKAHNDADAPQYFYTQAAYDAGLVPDAASNYRGPAPVPHIDVQTPAEYDADSSNPPKVSDDAHKLNQEALDAPDANGPDATSAADPTVAKADTVSSQGKTVNRVAPAKE